MSYVKVCVTVAASAHGPATPFPLHCVSRALVCRKNADVFGPGAGGTKAHVSSCTQSSDSTS
ncbi:hypothetical protein BE20_01360 [Sorangium cellulosum]|nr:hypothetical protein BE20_01360 [Sorangium cellulosum]